MYGDIRRSSQRDGEPLRDPEPGGGEAIGVGPADLGGVDQPLRGAGPGRRCMPGVDPHAESPEPVDDRAHVPFGTGHFHTALHEHLGQARHAPSRDAHQVRMRGHDLRAGLSPSPSIHRHSPLVRLAAVGQATADAGSAAPALLSPNIGPSGTMLTIFPNDRDGPLTGDMVARSWAGRQATGEAPTRTAGVRPPLQGEGWVGGRGIIRRDDSTSEPRLNHERPATVTDDNLFRALLPRNPTIWGKIFVPVRDFERSTRAPAS